MSRCFSVVYVDQSYDDVFGVECIASFDTEQEANDFKSRLAEEYGISCKKRQEYIENFVENIVIPETDYKGWLGFLPQFFGAGHRHISPKEFKGSLRSYLYQHRPKIEGYDPPEIVGYRFYSLFVVEIK